MITIPYHVQSHSQGPDCTEIQLWHTLGLHLVDAKLCLIVNLLGLCFARGSERNSKCLHIPQYSAYNVRASIPPNFKPGHPSEAV